MLDKNYDPQTLEKNRYRLWEEQGYFVPADQTGSTRDDGAGGGAYCIMIPPPNVTGSLHMGHGFNNTIMDTMVRYHRMKGDRTLWQPGTDHAGIATQMVVERQLEAAGQTRHDLGRDAFIERVWDWKQESGGNITRQLRRLGSSLDWQHERFTMDEGLSNAVREVFVRLFEEGLIYRGKRLVNWDPALHTAVSDLEVISEEESGHMWDIRYPLALPPGATGPAHLVVSTTRPETLLGDCAVAVNPEDPRYRHLIGEFVELPLTGRRIPVIADEHADPEFGTGCVKITPAHDFNDHQVWLRHRDETAIADQPHGGLINILTPDAAIRDNLPEEGTLLPAAYIGLDRYEARKRVVADLDALGLLAAVKEHRLQQPRGDRSGAVIEPYLTDQWYVRVAPLAEPAIAAVEDGRIRFVPDNWKNTYYDWMRNIQDWCISRQIWWGHRIPAWYDVEGNVYVGRSEDAVRTRHGFGPEVVLLQDPDVLDTWFSSALWPFSTLGWPEQTDRLSAFYPTSVLVTGFDIIFFWVARMIMMGLKFMGDVPFKDVYIHGLVRDAHGEKMSKSKGNVVSPQDVMKTLGADIIRLWVAATDYRGEMSVSDEILKRTADAYRRIRNTARFLLANLNGFDPAVNRVAPADMIELDRWVVDRAWQLQEEIVAAYRDYQFHLIYQKIHNFCVVDLGGFYLDVIKDRQYTTPTEGLPRRSCQTAMYHIAEAMARWLAPILSFTADEIWRYLPGEREPSVFLATWYQGLFTLDAADSFDRAFWDQVLAVRLAVAKPLEAARQAGLIGSGLDAELDLYAAPELAATLDRLGDELRFALITSAAPVHPLAERPADAQDTELAGLAVQVRKSTHPKCVRCWHLRPDVGADPAHPELCGRCVDNVAGTGEERRFA